MAEEVAEAQRLEEERAEEASRLEAEAEAQRQADEAEAAAQRLADEAEAQQLEQQNQTSVQSQSPQLEDALPLTQVPTFEATVSAEAVEAEIQQDITELATEAREVVAETATPEATTRSGDMPLVLAVDDSPTIRKLVTMTLEREGFEVITAADGLEALQLLSEHMPDIILSDVNMPRLDGYKLCRFVKKHERTKHIPVVMLSGKDGVFDKLRGKMFGCGDYITKPFESGDLVEKVRLHTGVYSG